MKVAVIGAGNWGKNLVRTFQQLGALGAIVESDPIRRNELALEYPSVRVLSDLSDLDPLEIAGLAIATPVSTHYSVAREAIERGFDVFVEKPMTLSAEEATRLVDFAQAKGRVLMVGHLLLYQPAVQWLASFIAEGGIGRLLSLHQERLNFGRARSVENALWSLGVHDVAVMLSLVPSEVAAFRVSGQCAVQPGIEDDVYLHLDFENGVQAHLHTSWLWAEKRRCLTVVGDKAMLVYDELAQTVSLHKKRIDSRLNHEDQGVEVVFRQTGEPLRLELEHFLARLADRKEPLSSGRNGVAVVTVLENVTKALQTMRTGKV